ncbi:ABC transporter substrate-binding protein [Frigidibacter sp. MR17.14]|uniref:ABC transporter substrate-binding protein n=1 Tax=Frigidibacter sp. MR17.14 TaxID=3126509 RepID=UPI0030131A5C
MRMSCLAAVAALAAGLAGAAQAGGNLYFGLSGEPSTMDAAIQTGTTFRTVKLAIHRGLVNYGIDGKLSNELAESYEVSPDAKVFTFHLRDAKFHDGSPVTAADVKATFDRIMAPGSTASFRNQFELVDKIETPDPKTVVISLKKAAVSFIHYLALPESVILPASWIAAHGADPNTAAPIGAGPFKFDHWTRGRELVVEKFDDYYKPGLPKLDSVTYQFYADENTRVNAIKSGEVDIIDYVPARELKALEADPDIRLESTFGPFMGLQYNVSNPALANPDVRRAIAYAVDRSVIVNTAFDGVGTPIYGLAIPEGYGGYDETKKDFYKVDIPYAKELMAKAGYPDGFEARIVASSQYSFHQNTAIALQSELAKIGIKLTLDLPDWTTRMSKLSKGDYDMAVMGTVGEITDPDWLTNHYYGGENLVRTANSAHYQDAEIDRLLDEGRATADPTKRDEIYKQFVDRALDQAPILFLMWRDQSYAVRETVKDFTNMPAFLSFQSGFSLENTDLD